MAGFVKPKKVSRVSPFFFPNQPEGRPFLPLLFVKASHFRCAGGGKWGLGWMSFEFFLGSLDNEMMCDFHMFSLFWSSKV